jgi:menaquinone-dependent protoporphyrinogen oxidase
LKVLIAYSSKHGFTKRCAELLAEKLQGSKVMSLDGSDKIDLESFDAVILGSSVYVGSVRKPVAKFCQENLGVLKTKRLGFFVCCGFEDKANEQMKSGIPQELLLIAKATGHFGYNFADIGKVDSFIAKMVKAPVGTTLVKGAEIDSFAEAMMG